MAHPPPYEEAIAVVDVIKLVSRYFDDASLVNSSRVCKRWNIMMNTRLWQNPITCIAKRSHPFGKHYSRALRSLTKMY